MGLRGFTLRTAQVSQSSSRATVGYWRNRTEGYKSNFLVVIYCRCYILGTTVLLNF